MIIDIVVGVLVLISAFISFLRGFIREVLTIAGVIGGIIAAIVFGPALAPMTRQWLGAGDGQADSAEKLFGLIPREFAADIATYGGIFVAVVIVLYIITHFISGAAKAVGLGPVDRTLGVMFGVARAVILLAFIYIPLNVLMPKDVKESVFKDSITHPLIEETSSVIAAYLPEGDSVKDDVEDQFKQRLKDSELLATGSKDKSENPQAVEPAGATPDGSPPAQIPPPAASGETGYQQDQRQKMQQLFNEPATNE